MYRFPASRGGSGGHGGGRGGCGRRLKKLVEQKHLSLTVLQRVTKLRHFGFKIGLGNGQFFHLLFQIRLIGSKSLHLFRQSGAALLQRAILRLEGSELLGQAGSLRLGFGQLRLRVGQEFLDLGQRGIQRVGAVLFVGQLGLRVGKDLLDLGQRGIQRVGAVLLVGQLRLRVGSELFGLGQLRLQIGADGFGVLQQGVELGDFLVLGFQPGSHGGDLILKISSGGGELLKLGGQFGILLRGVVFSRKAHNGQHNGHEQRDAHDVERRLIPGLGRR